MIKKKIKVGIIGTNFAIKVHYPSLKRHRLFNVTSIASASKEKAKNCAQKYGIPYYYTNWEELLENGVDAIAIAVPPHIQHQIIESAIKKNIHIFAEKPLTGNLKNAQNICSSIRDKKIAHMINFAFPYIKEWQKLKTLLHDDIVGQIRHININWHVENRNNLHLIQNWKSDNKNGGGTTYNFTSHVFFYLEFLFGKIKSLSFTKFSIPHNISNTDVVNLLSVELHSGVPVSISVDTASFLGSGHTIEIYGNKGTIVLKNQSMDYMRFSLYTGTRDKKKLSLVSSSKIPKNIDSRIMATSQLIDKFYNWINSNKKTSPNFFDGLRVEELIDRANYSHKHKKWINIF